MNYSNAATDDLSRIAAWFAGRLPDGMFLAPPEVSGDPDELLVVGQIPDVELGDDADEAARVAARSARIARFRQETRGQRMRVADEAQHRFGRKVSWGAVCGGVRENFTTVGIPVMTRLRLAERGVLDTLIDAGVARSRSDALAWCVRLVREHQGEWIKSLREALAAVERVRAQGPGGSS